MEQSGLVNAYMCQRCGLATVTRNQDEGTTPFAISCRATPDCHGDAFSSFYRVEQDASPAFLWVRPTVEQLETMKKKIDDPDGIMADAIQAHYDGGGLFLADLKGELLDE